MNKLIQLFNKNYYSEGKYSTTLHNGKHYLVDDVIKAARDVEPIEVTIRSLEWFLEPPECFSKNTLDRINAVTLDYPPIVCRVSEGLVTLDGYHRVLKARLLGHKTIQVKVLTKLPKPVKGGFEL